MRDGSFYIVWYVMAWLDSQVYCFPVLVPRKIELNFLLNVDQKMFALDVWGGEGSDENGPGMIWGASLAKNWDREQLNVTNSMMKFKIKIVFSDLFFYPSQQDHPPTLTVQLLILTITNCIKQVSQIIPVFKSEIKLPARQE